MVWPGQRIVARKSAASERETHLRMKLQLQSVIWDFPEGFDVLREEARAEDYKHIERLFSEWQSGETKFDKDDEGLLVVLADGELAAVGGITQDPSLKRTLRM